MRLDSIVGDVIFVDSPDRATLSKGPREVRSAAGGDVQATVRRGGPLQDGFAFRKPLARSAYKLLIAFGRLWKRKHCRKQMISEHKQPGDPMPEWLDLKTLTGYACVSERTVREWIHRPTNPLPATQVGTKILIRRTSFDQWVENHRLKSVDVGCMVDEILAGVAGPN